MKTKRITITLPLNPSIDFSGILDKLRRLAALFSTYGDRLSHGLTPTDRKRTWRFRKPTFKLPKVPNFDRRQMMRIFIPVFGVLLLGVVVIVAIRNYSEGNRQVQSAQVSIGEPIDSQTLNKAFAFPITDGEEEITRFEYIIEDVEIRDDIIVDGKPGTAVKGRTFLIVRLKIRNDYNQSISIDTRDYVRLSVNGDDSEWLAPNIHNDPVEAQAISARDTRVGFVVNTTDDNFVLRIGEINGEKESIPLDLEYK